MPLDMGRSRPFRPQTDVLGSAWRAKQCADSRAHRSLPALMGKEASARSWAGLPVVVHGEHLAGLGEDDRFQRTEALSAHIGKEVPVAWDVQSSKPAARRASFQLA